MGENWPDCIVTLLDLAETKKLALAQEGRASRLMRQLHQVAGEAFRSGMVAHDGCYCWNDSILLLALWDGSLRSANRILIEASDLKKRVDTDIGTSYAISVKGRAFPIESNENLANARCVVLKSSSYAMGNCFLIETEARRRKLRDDWYIDSRLKGAVIGRIVGLFRADLLPRRKQREILRIKGYISLPA